MEMEPEVQFDELNPEGEELTAISETDEGVDKMGSRSEKWLAKVEDWRGMKEVRV